MMEGKQISTNKRIAKNTIYLYSRMLLITIVSLFTSRITLQVLGFDDYGIYTVVGGFLMMFSSIVCMMTGATQRFITFELGKQNFDRLRIVFSTSVYLHLAIALVFFLAAQTIGMWYLQHKMVIPENRYSATVIVFQLSVISMMVNITQIPYNAMLIAYEKMGIYAYISVLEIFLKVVLTASLFYLVSMDTLILYAIFMLLVAIIIRLVYYIYVKKTINESVLLKVFDLNLITKMSGFAGWSLFGTISYLSINQAIPVLLNRFFGVVVNAAMGIANQVSGTINGFVYNFQIAFKPQIVKLYSQQNYTEMEKLVFRASKFSFTIMMIVSIPVIMTIDYLLKLWLGDVPDNTSIFCKLVLVYCLIDTLTVPIWTSIEATGCIRTYQLVVGAFFIAYIPFSYLMLKLGFRACDILLLKIVMSLLIHAFRVLIMKKVIPEISIIQYLKQVVVPVVMASFFIIASSFIPFGRVETFCSFFKIGLMYFVWSVIISYIFLLKEDEKNMIKVLFVKKITNWKK